MKGTKVKLGQWCKRIALTAMAVCFMWVLAGVYALQVQAEVTGKVTVSAAKVRKEASTSSDQVGSLGRGATFTISGETTGTDGKIWYQVVCSDGTKGYVRSDLAEKQGENVNDTVTAQITKLNPVSASVTGKQVNVRKNCTTESSAVASIPSGTVLTITGQTTGTDSKVWYEVTFISDNKEVKGFIRSDFVEPSAALTPYEEPVVDPGTDPGTTGTEEPPVEETKDWDTSLADDGRWMVTENATGKSYAIKDLIDISKENATKLTEATASLKGQKTAIIILVIVLVLLLGVIGLLVFMFREELLAMLPGREEILPQRRPAGSQRPQGQRPANGQPQGQRPAGQRPAGSQPQGQRPAGSQPQGQRPAGSQPQGQRPAGGQPQSQRPAGSQPQGQRPAGSQPQGQRPAGAQPQGQRPAGTSFSAADLQNGEDRIRRETARNLEQQQIQKTAAPKNGAASGQQRPKNFMADEDEFEFEFLNWQGADEDK